MNPKVGLYTHFVMYMDTFSTHIKERSCLANHCPHDYSSYPSWKISIKDTKQLRYCKYFINPATRINLT